jgi:peptide deformylase
MDVTVKAMDAAGRPLQFRAREFEARVLQHEIDHLNGVLFIDLADPDSLHMLPPDEDRGEAGSAPPRE